MADEDRVNMDAIVVGGGPAGLTAAYTMARAGMEVILVERGEYSGAKNVGGLLYGTVLNQLIPDFYQKAPIERSVSKRKLVFLGDGEHLAMEFGAEEWSQPPYNNTFIVHRSQFDKWYATQAEEAGANLLEGMVAEDLIYEGHGADRRAVGVRLRGDEEFYADSVVLADGANCLVSEKARKDLAIRGGPVHQEYAVGIKEIIGLPKGKIEDRFGLDDGEGAAIDFFGVPFEGLVGGGFIYTGKEAIHLGFAARIESMKQLGLGPNEVIDRLKAHPVVRRYLEGGELLEYSAHMIPEAGYDAVGDLTANGVMIAGDAAGFVNMSIYKEGTNHAMESGRYAGETAAAAKQKGDFSRQGLAGYMERLAGGVVLKDLRKYRKVPFVLEHSPDLLSLYPKKVNRMLIDFFSVADEPKAAIQKKAFKTFMKGLPKFRFVRDLIRAKKLM